MTVRDDNSWTIRPTVASLYFEGSLTVARLYFEGTSIVAQPYFKGTSTEAKRYTKGKHRYYTLHKRDWKHLI
jgi:hypothetical protein